jgi:N-acetylglucosamine-6-phosphate deacetylase
MTRKGFVDLQVNGYLGVDFSSPALQMDDICRITEAMIGSGTVGYCATLITAPAEVYARNLPLIAKAMDVPGVRGHLLGIHLEGPFLSPEDGARGAHQACWMRHPDRDFFRALQDQALGAIKLLTLAPELEGAIDLIDYVRRNLDTSISLGHHLAGREIIRDAVAAGATLITHLGNGIPNLIHRHTNPVIHQLADEGLSAGLITDGHHIPEDFIRIVLRCKGAEGVFVVSDSAPIAGLQPGVYTNMGIRVRMTPSGRIEQLDAPYLAGSGFTLAQCMRFLRSLQILTDDQLWQVGYATPLSILGRTESCLALTDLPDFLW